MLICVRNRDLPSFSLLGLLDFTEADRLQLILEPKVMGHHRGGKVQSRKLTAVEGRQEGTMLGISGCREEGKDTRDTFPSLGIPFLLGSHR